MPRRKTGEAAWLAVLPSSAQLSLVWSEATRVSLLQGARYDSEQQEKKKQKREPHDCIIYTERRKWSREALFTLRKGKGSTSAQNFCSLVGILEQKVSKRGSSWLHPQLCSWWQNPAVARELLVPTLPYQGLSSTSQNTEEHESLSGDCLRGSQKGSQRSIHGSGEGIHGWSSAQRTHTQWVLDGNQEWFLQAQLTR